MSPSRPHAVVSLLPLVRALSCLSLLFCSSGGMQVAATQAQNFTLASARDALVRQEDTIVFCLIERTRYPSNSRVYDPRGFSGGFGGRGRSLVEVFVRWSEKVQAKAGRYQNPEEIPFFPEGLPISLVPPHSFPNFLYPAAASVNVSRTIWSMYTDEFLPTLIAGGDDGNYASTAASDLACLQALSRRIHYGRFVAEVKFRGAPEDYTPAIRSQDKQRLTKLLTNKRVEDAVKRRVKKKAETFGQNVTLDDVDEKGNGSRTAYKLDPLVAYRLYGDWVIPLTKLVEVEYLLHRLD